MLLTSLGTGGAQTDPTFTKITVGNIVTDLEGSISGTWGDYDGDGFLDLYVANSGFSGVLNSLYRNNGDGTFTKQLTNSFLTTLGATSSATWADLDNDGDLDLVVARFYSGPVEILFNEGAGVFRPILTTNTATVRPFNAGLADMNGDGWLDVFLSNAAASPPVAYLNQADGAFRRLTASEMGEPLLYPASSYYPAWGDYDNDGDADLLLSTPNGVFLYQNDGKGKFARVMVGSLATETSTCSVQWVDYDNDGWLDVSVVGITRAIALHRNLGGTNFVNQASTAQLGSAIEAYDSAWGDADNDGDLDLFVVNEYNRTNTFYRNNGDRTFTSVDIGSPIHDGDHDVGVNWVDYDNDGHLDLFIACGDVALQANLLYHNDGNTNHWLKVKLSGQASNRSGVGAKIRVTSRIGGQVFEQTRQISACGYGAGHGLIAHFGLGDATVAEKVRIEWPSGNVQELASQPVDRILTVTEQVLITPVRPTASLGGSITLTSQRSGTRQWYHDGVLLEGQTGQSLNLSNIQVADGGRYAVVTSSGGISYTNFVYLVVDTQFTKVTTGPVVTDTGNCPAVSWGDYDGDGYADLFVSRYQLGSSAVYRNNRDGTFGRILNLPFGRTSNEIGVWGDMDNDGSVDLLHELLGTVGGACLSASVYFNNADDTFTMQQRAPMVGYGNRSLVDYNNDGFLDAYYCRFAQNSLYRNNGDRTFTLMTATEVGPVATVTTFGAACWADFNDDGWPDLYAPHRQGNQSLMFRNDGTGRFVAVTNLVTRTTARAISGAWGDYDNDGRLDLCVVAHDGTSVVYRNLGNGEFERPAGTPTLTGSENCAAWGDYDNDGFLDLFFSDYQSGNKLFRNNGDGTFTRITTGSIVNELPLLGAGSYGGLWLDYDNDGFLDLYVINGDDASSISTANQLYHNNGNSNAWLRVRLVGTISNRDGVGAKVRAYAYYAGAYRWQRRDISAGDEENGNHLTADFGLGNATLVTKLRVEWPSGVKEDFASVPLRRILTIVEPSLKGSLAVDGKFHVSMTMSTNRVYQLQTSTNLVDWTVVTNFTGSGSCTPVEYVDPEPPALGASRYYRLK